ncbi:MAG: YeeE/YedE family protein [Anaerolineales bacterium]|nr:YeeE/YedE family protein [Anaerolineales bacterium]
MTVDTQTQPRKSRFSLKKLFQREGKPYTNPYLGGILLGIVLFLSFLITGQGLGASGTLSRVAVFVEDLVAPDHVDRVPYLLEMAGGKTNPLDYWIVFVTIGTILGGFTSGLIHGRTKWETTRGPNISNRTRWMLAFVGGILFAYGARMARGCTSGQALSGGASLSAGSWVVMFAIFGGAYGLAYFLRKVWN